MKKVFQKTATELNKRSKERRLWKKIFRPLVFVAVFCATYALILPAITMEGEPVCGFEEHIHSESCFEQIVVEELVCGLEDNSEVFHEHTENCYKNDGTLVCTEPDVSVHTHGEDCFRSETKENLLCEKEEHIHTEICYSSEEADADYICGMGVHSHVETCYDEAGTLTCTIPEHAHEASCVSENVDSSSDLETEENWKDGFAEIDFTGNWAKDLLAVAKTQVGYSESETNVVLEKEVFKGYTRYGEKYGDPYGDWSGMFVSFCAEYAGITDFPLVKNPEEWLLELDAGQNLLSAKDSLPETGDIVFVDTDSDGEAELLGIVSGTVSGTDKIEFIAGDTENNKVEYVIFDIADPAVLGYYKLPKNPMAKEEIDSASTVAEMISALPSAEEAKAKLAEFNKVLDKESFDKYVLEHSEKISEIKEIYETLDDAQKMIAGDISVLAEIETVLRETVWQQLPVLDGDKAAVSELNATISENTYAEKGETVLFGFTAKTKAYTDEKFSEARVKFEFEIALSSEKAAFDLAAMPWLEEAVVTTEKRAVGEEEKDFQILTGYKRIKAATADESVVPGTISESAAVKILDMSHGENVSVKISAAAEHGTWEGKCAVHGTEEKLTVESQTVRVRNPLGEGEQKAEYEALHAEYEVINAMENSEEKILVADELWNKVAVKYLEGCISEEAFIDLSDKLYLITVGGEMPVSEIAEGYNWKLLQNSGWFEEHENSEEMHAESEFFAAPVFATAFRSAARLGATPGTTSSVQIINEGGSNVSSEGAVYVSKTIEGTEIENVFDITLEVITQDIVNEVYKEPDMAVVIVMDISNTMRTAFGSTTRYAAAMTAAENFIEQFAENNKGASKIGFVAFNSDAHQIFALSQCSTTAQADSLVDKMKDETGKIINKSGYADDRKRFTNIEAGLKRGWDMVKDADNEHKYVIFLSDGFPTTYIKSGYVGYDTYTSSGTKGADGVFYDYVTKYYCSYGTSYSDKAAIRARQQATTIKNAGGTVFSIGVDIGGQTIAGFDGRTGLSVIDRTGTTYEIGSATSTQAYKNWLKDKIGSGYYYDSTNSNGLNNAFSNIFAQIKELNAQSSHLDWVATDPMGDMGIHDADSVEFIGFYNINEELVEGALAGESRDGAQYENTATFDTDKNTIHWDIKQSGYISVNAGNITNYRCALKYRVRLQNEMDGFVERQTYYTNDVTSLTYRVIEQTGNNVTISERRTVEFPIPAVEGYLAELEFTKTNNSGELLKGASFKLTHDTESCGFCRGDGKGHVSIPEKNADSNGSSTIKFEGIPSGHSYLLTETVAPDGYKPSENVYRVTVAYDTTTVTITAKDGSDVPWEGTVVNEIQYVLPSTGGSGTDIIYTSGAMLLTASAIMYGYSRRRKRRKGARD
ncbi:MAG: VWA domain-containing protein [Oscillospiraceae bacterium]|nr:VWA domain-containing protein [Oscillospiraceae bacterium]